MNVSKILIAALAVFLLSGQAVFGQWTTSGDDIHNSNSGNVGIGTIAPTAALEVAGGRLQVTGTTVPIGGLGVEVGIDGGGRGLVLSYDRDASAFNEMRYNALSHRFDISASNKMIIDATGNVGIGTTSPAQLHHVHQTTGTSAATNYSNSTTGTTQTDGLYVGYDDQGYVWNYENAGLQFATNNAPRMTITAGGDVGIGTATPHLNGAQRTLAVVAGATGHSRAGLVLDGSRTDMGSFGSVEFFHQGNKLVQLSGYRDGADDAAGFRVFTTPSGSGWSERFRITATGNVGIGTTTPARALSVNGEIEAEEVVVVPDVPADFVFEDEYPLPSLEEVAQHIDEHGHLPEIPSAAEMKADGVGLSTMQMKLLQKIEELTLYLIEQNKVLADVQEENTHLKQRLIALEAAGN